MEASASYWRFRRVGMTGATGFIGHHLAARLAGLGAMVVAAVRARSNIDRLLTLGAECSLASLDEPDALARAFAGCDVVFHLAGAVHFGNDWGPVRHTNVQGTANVLAAARSAGVRRLIHSSSIVAVGGGKQPTPLDETSTWNLGQLSIPYVSTKREAEELVVAHEHSPEVVIVNPACVIGPDDFHSSEFGTLCRRFWRGRVPFYFGGGNNFVDVRDVAEGMLLAAEKGRTGERYILGGANLRYAEFFSLLERAANQRIMTIRLPNFLAPLGARLVETFSRSRHPILSRAKARMMGLYLFFDCAKAQRELGYAPRPLASALADTHQYWMAKKAA